MRSDAEITYWMSWPDLWFEFGDDRGLTLLTLGLVAPDWLRWDPHGDLELADPGSLTAWLAAWT